MWCFSSCRRKKSESIPEVSERFKYALNGVYTIENFSLNASFFGLLLFDIGSLCGKDWFIVLARRDDDTMGAKIERRYSPNRVEMKIGAYFNFVNKNKKVKLENKIYFELFNWSVTSKFIKMRNILNERKGWLVNDELSFEYGIHVHAMKENNGRWKFHFEGKPFNCQEKDMIKLRYSKTIDSNFFGFNKKFLSYHTNHFDGSPGEVFSIQDDMNPKLVNECFQTAHGIRITVSNEIDLLSMMQIASHYKLSNVVKFLERQIFQLHVSSENIQLWTRKAIHFDLNHLLSQLMRKDDTSEILEVIKTETPEMSGRIMKMFIAKYLYNKV